MYRAARPEETSDLIALAVATGLFQQGEAEELLGGVLQDFHAGRLGEGHEVGVWEDAASKTPHGWVYFSPSFKTGDVYDLWWIGVDPRAQGTGIGSALMAEVEARAKGAGARLLIVETSDTELLAPTRNFYARRGYHNCGTIPDFYGEGDGKVTFARKL